jgi:hypothetical protein
MSERSPAAAANGWKTRIRLSPSGGDRSRLGNSRSDSGGMQIRGATGRNRRKSGATRMETIDKIVLASSALVGAVSALAGAIIAGIGLRTWRHELRGRVEYDLARRVLKGVLELRNEIQQIRNVFSTECPDTRWERLDRKAGELDLSLVEAKVLWGQKLDEPKRQLKQCLDILWANKRLSYDSENKGLQLTDARREEMIAILFGHGRTDDQFGNKVQAAVAACEDALRPHLNR